MSLDIRVHKLKLHTRGVIHLLKKKKKHAYALRHLKYEIKRDSPLYLNR